MSIPTGHRFFHMIVGMVACALLLSVVAMPVPTASAQDGGATLTVQPETAPQNSTITLSLAGFRPEEPVTIWQTSPAPDFVATTLGTVRVSEEGGATLSFFVNSTDNRTGVHAFTAFGNESLRRAVGFLELTRAEGAAPSSDVSIAARSTVQRQGEAFAFVGSGYDPRESVALWINLPDGVVRDVGRTFADGDGVFRYAFSLGTSFPIGTYQLTAFGEDSRKTGIIEFELLPGGDSGASPQVTLVMPQRVFQGNVVALEGTGFGLEEEVAIWATLENGRVFEIRDIKTRPDGTFSTVVRIDPGDFPLGTHRISAQGKISRLIGIVAFEVVPRSGD